MLQLMLIYLLGAVGGYILAYVMNNKTASGYLKIDTSIPEDGPYLFLELTKDPSCLEKHKYITLKIDTHK